MSQLFNAAPGKHEQVEQQRQRLMPQVKDLSEGDLLQHIAYAGTQKGSKLFQKASEVFVEYRMPGSKFELLDKDSCLPFSLAAHTQLMAQWDKDLRLRCGAPQPNAIADAFKATTRKKAPESSGVAATRPIRSSRSGRSLRESTQAEDEEEAGTPGDMSVLITTGRNSVLKSYRPSAGTRKKFNVDCLTAVAADSIRNSSHRTYGEHYGAYISDAAGAEVELVDMFIGQTVLELNTPADWKLLGFPPVMRCHLVAVDARDDEEEGGDPETLLDFSLFHDDYKVEVYTWERLLELETVVLPNLTVTEKYEAVYTDGTGVKKALRRDEYMAGFEFPRSSPFQTIPLRM